MIVRFLQLRAPRMAGVLLALMGYSVFSVQDAIVKWLVADHAVAQIMFVRSATALLLCLMLGRRSLLIQVAASRNKRPLLLRGALILVAWFCYYSAARQLQLAELVTIYFAAPMFVTLLSVLVLGERVRWPRWLGVSLGFTGVVIACQPGRFGLSPAAGLVLFSALVWAYTNILVRQISRFESTMMQMLFSNAAFTVVCGIALPWIWMPSTPVEILLMVVLGLTGAAGQFLLFEGFRLAAASLVAPFEYVTIVWAFALSYAVWGDIPRPAVFIGAGVIAASGLVVMLGEWLPDRRGRAATAVKGADSG
jgi:drug/metabolite transporter (DMT)-like permease